MRRVLAGVGLAVTVGASYLAVRRVDFDDVGAALGRSNYAWLVPALGALAVGVFLRALRWRSLYAPATRPPLRPVVRALLIGYFFNNVLPARAGEAARIVALHRDTGASRPETLSTVLAERAYDVASLLLMLFLLAPLFPELSWFRSAALLALIVAGLLALIVAPLVFARQWTVSLVAGLLARLPFVPKDRTERAATYGAQGFASMLQPAIAARALAWTVASWLAIALSYWFVFLAFHIQVSPLAGILVCITVGLGMALPSSPGAVGVFEVAAATGAAAYGVPPATALSFALVLHAVNFFPYLIAGALALPRRTRLVEAPA